MKRVRKKIFIHIFIIFFKSWITKTVCLHKNIGKVGNKKVENYSSFLNILFILNIVSNIVSRLLR
jgi:hypothetical protein